jgi:hypothetical protein
LVEVEGCFYTLPLLHSGGSGPCCIQCVRLTHERGTGGGVDTSSQRVPNLSICYGTLLYLCIGCCRSIQGGKAGSFPPSTHPSNRCLMLKVFSITITDLGVCVFYLPTLFVVCSALSLLEGPGSVYNVIYSGFQGVTVFWANFDLMFIGVQWGYLGGDSPAQFSTVLARSTLCSGTAHTRIYFHNMHYTTHTYTHSYYYNSRRCLRDLHCVQVIKMVLGSTLAVC